MARSSSRSRYDPTYTYPILPVHPDSKAHLPWGQLVEAPWFGVAFDQGLAQPEDAAR
eukprot:CAMPEP_0174708988 /NCGR_PEP_ID=MMETSP1094-20130205/11091_1 /TAXON_ID=156173 /ORGANISM="Chrysochromulina brevifilum, Strain UTEX LB 985" /LENGTH=56 /DNA_ID=CAMNT_0015907613 /DNA_START=1 /DNA_END=168 /DNA_ORIENTATION=+